MSFKSALAAILIAGACAGCATSGGSWVGSGTTGSVEGQGSPSTWDNRAWDYRFGGPCSSGTYLNRASGLCVSGGQ